MVSIDDPHTCSNDNVVYLWNYVPVEYSTKRIVIGESFHGMFNSYRHRTYYDWKVILLQASVCLSVHREVPQSLVPVLSRGYTHHVCS